jgi:hypothetical protein
MFNRALSGEETWLVKRGMRAEEEGLVPMESELEAFRKASSVLLRVQRLASGSSRAGADGEGGK